MRILVACEYSGRVRDAFIAKGHDAISCDILPTEAPGPHVQGDVRAMLQQRWDLVIAFPPCTDLAASNAHNLKVKAADGRTDAGAAFFMECFNANATRVCVENPAGVMSSRFRKPDQYVDPWWFGDPWNKRTGLWLHGLPKLEATHIKADYDEEPSPWHSGSGVQRGGVRSWVNTRQAGGRNPHTRAATFPGVARAMAEQWGS